MNAQEKTAQEERTKEDARLGEAAVQAFVSYFPEPARKAALARNIKEMVPHVWQSENAMRGVLEAMEGAKAAHELGFANQVKHQLLKAEDRFLFDVSNKAIVLARKCGCELKPLAKLGKEPGRQFEIRGVPIRGRNVRWRFVEIESYESPIPTHVLKNARAIRAIGIEWDRVFVAEPIIEIPAVRVSVGVGNDPILAASRGRWLWEIGRWQ